MCDAPRAGAALALAKTLDARVCIESFLLWLLTTKKTERLSVAANVMHEGGIKTVVVMRDTIGLSEVCFTSKVISCA
jgi:hypothetical protein